MLFRDIFLGEFGITDLTSGRLQRSSASGKTKAPHHRTLLYLSLSQ
jgi:hypothetical protein